MQTAFSDRLSAFLFSRGNKPRKKFSKKIEKTLDKQKNYVIILKCVIILFSFGGILRFFQEIIVKMSNSFLKKHSNITKNP